MLLQRGTAVPWHRRRSPFLQVLILHTPDPQTLWEPAHEIIAIHSGKFP